MIPKVKTEARVLETESHILENCTVIYLHYTTKILWARYGSNQSSMSEYFKQWAQNLTHVSEVAKVILQAVTSDDPNFRYVVGKTTEEGKPVLRGCAIWSTDSTGKLAFLDNMFL